MMNKLLFKAGDDWTPEILDAAWEEIETIAREELPGLTWYKPQIEVVSAKQMMDAYTSVGMPIYYKHWSFGKEFTQIEKEYKNGQMGLAYELVINSDPCIAYLMEENSALMQVFVIAHASIGHSAFFKNNYLFAERTDASSIVEYLKFAKNYLKMCEEKYGMEEVETVLDACHALQAYGVDRYKKTKKLKPKAEEELALKRFEQELKDYDPVWERVGKKRTVVEQEKDSSKLAEPQENILYFIEKYAPELPGWKREVIRIVRKLAHYFSPQGITKLTNEGFASFCHYYIMNRLYDKGLIDAGSMFEMLASHTNVVYQRKHAQFNPYAVGFEIFMDIKRICERPTPEDIKYFPKLANTPWVPAVIYAMENFKDETFILQYLSPTVARKLQLFAFNDPAFTEPVVTVTDISNERGFYKLREKFAAMYAVENRVPDIQVTHYDSAKTRTLSLKHFVVRGRPMDMDIAEEVIAHVAELWEYPVELTTFDLDVTDGPEPKEVLNEVKIYTNGKYGAAFEKSPDTDESGNISWVQIQL